MGKKALHTKVDEDVKDQAQKLAKEMGLPLSVVVNGLLKQFIRDGELTFSTVPKMSKKLEAIIAEAEADLKEGKNISGPFATAEEAQSHLDSLKK